MKKRNGFVSNSSSSSFVVVGKPISYREVEKELDRGSSVYMSSYEYSDSGVDFFEFTKEMAKAVKDVGGVDGTFYVVYQYGESLVLKGDIPPGATAFGLEVDQWHTDSLDDFIKRYIDEDPY